MKLFLPYKRAALLIPSGPDDDPDRKHLFILLSDPLSIESLQCNLLVPISTRDHLRMQDLTCELSKGDHDFIRHDSFVFYAKMRHEETSKLLKAVAQGTFISHESLREDIFARIVTGAITSKFTPLKYVHLLAPKS